MEMEQPSFVHSLWNAEEWQTRPWPHWPFARLRERWQRQCVLGCSKTFFCLLMKIAFLLLLLLLGRFLLLTRVIGRLLLCVLSTDCMSCCRLVGTTATLRLLFGLCWLFVFVDKISRPAELELLQPPLDNFHEKTKMTGRHMRLFSGPNCHLYTIMYRTSYAESNAYF